MRKSMIFLLPAFLAALLPALCARAETAEADFAKALVRGPASVQLRDEAMLDLPGGMIFAPQKQAETWLRKMGNFPQSDLVGMIVPDSDEPAKWFVVVEYEPSGHVKEDESADIDATKLLTAMRQGNDELNGKRKAMGMPQMEVVGWIEPPHYDAATHHLIWSVEGRNADASADQADRSSVNYNTRILGRGGYLSLDLIASREAIDAQKSVIDGLLPRLRFNQGKRYEDFDAKTDKTAEYGLIALIGGVAAHKLGFFAIIAAFAAKFVKIWIVAAAGGFAAIRNVFRRKRGQ